MQKHLGKIFGLPLHPDFNGNIPEHLHISRYHTDVHTMDGHGVTDIKDQFKYYFFRRIYYCSKVKKTVLILHAVECKGSTF